MMRATFVLLISLAAVVPAYAQDSPSLRPHRPIVSGGVSWSGSYRVGDATAELRGNGLGATATPFTLFTASSRFAPSTAPEFRVGVALTRRVAIDGGVSFGRPRIAIAIAGDAEAPAQELEGEKLDQYRIDAALTWQLPIGLGSKLAPFALVGGGYLRQLHEDRALAETGRIYYAGGGVRYWLRGGQRAQRDVGVRADVRVNFRQGGIDFENKMRAYPSLTLSLFVGL